MWRTNRGLFMQAVTAAWLTVWLPGGGVAQDSKAPGECMGWCLPITWKAKCHVTLNIQEKCKQGAEGGEGAICTYCLSGRYEKQCMRPKGWTSPPRCKPSPSSCGPAGTGACAEVGEGYFVCTKVSDQPYPPGAESYGLAADCVEFQIS